jgi:predicted MFS family arabinose efflux permease
MGHRIVCNSLSLKNGGVFLVVRRHANVRCGTPIALSLNASFMYLGFSPGAVLGSLTLSFTSVSNLGWTAAACEAAALILTLSIGRHLVRVQKAPVAAA